MNILKVPKDPSVGTPPNRTHEISFFPQHENEAINWKLLFRAFYRYKSSHLAKTKNIFLERVLIQFIQVIYLGNLRLVESLNLFHLITINSMHPV